MWTAGEWLWLAGRDPEAYGRITEDHIVRSTSMAPQPTLIELPPSAPMLLDDVPLDPTWWHERTTPSRSLAAALGIGRGKEHRYFTRYPDLDRVYRVYRGPLGKAYAVRVFEQYVEELDADPSTTVVDLEYKTVMHRTGLSLGDSRRLADRILNDLTAELVAMRL